MLLERTYCVGVVLCFLAVAGCSRPVDNPPASSYRVDNVAFSSDGTSQAIRAAYVTPAFFQAAKTQPLLGRFFLPQEYQSGGMQVVVLCNRFWKERFKGNPGCLGSTIQLNGRSFTIIGVIPPTFEFSPGVDVWVPAAE